MPIADFQKAALEWRIRTALRGTGQPETVANFLLAWWNAGECGGFDMKELWSVDTAIANDMITVVRLIAEQANYPDTLVATRTLPLSDVRVFGVLALESELVDPRLYRIDGV